MSMDINVDQPVPEGSGIEVISSGEDLGVFGDLTARPAGEQPLRVWIVGRTAIVRFVDAELLFEEAVIRMICDQLDHVIEAGYRRLVLNFTGVKYLSGLLLGRLVKLQKQADRVRCRIQFCGLDPLLWDVLRVTYLDLIFDVLGNEAEALGLAVRSASGAQ
jgi:anti-anti-sigma regulatory factor